MVNQLIPQLAGMAMERGMTPNLVAKSLPASIQRGDRGASPDASYQSEMSDVCIRARYSDSDEEYELVQKEESNLLPSFARQRSYGAVSDVQPVPRRNRGGRRRRQYRHSTTAVPTDLRELFGSYRKLEEVVEESSRDRDEDDEEPPVIEMIYRRNCKDKTKLILLPLIYFTFMVLAGVFAFYSIDALIESYHNRVRSVHDYYVTSYPPLGIAVFLEDFGTFHDCSFKINDDLAPIRGNFTPLFPSKNCTYTFVTFQSKLVGGNRTAMVFRGPMELKESIALNFTINTALREFGALEFMLIENWDSVTRPNAAAILANIEAKDPLYTVPAGFRTWIKVSKTVYDTDGQGRNPSQADFTLSFGFSSYNNWSKFLNQTTNIVYVLFEWKDDKYTYVTEILSTNIWNTLGSLAGIFVAMYKAGDLCTAWIKRIRRERRKKLARLQELEELQKRLMEEYEERKREREEQKQSLNEGTQRLSPVKESLRVSPMKEAPPHRERVSPHKDIPRKPQDES